jgi:kynurenine formamidase
MLLDTSTMKIEATLSCETRHSNPKGSKDNIHSHENITCHNLLLVENVINLDQTDVEKEVIRLSANAQYSILRCFQLISACGRQREDEVWTLE